MNVTFDFWTNLCGCGGGNVGGTCTMEMSEDELQVFKQANEMTEEDEAEKIIDYFEGKMPEELIDRCMEDNCYGVLDFYVVEISFD